MLEMALVVEDEILIRMVIADYLRDCRYKVVEVSNADEATAVFQHDAIKTDVVFSDIRAVCENSRPFAPRRPTSSARKRD